MQSTWHVFCHTSAVKYQSQPRSLNTGNRQRIEIVPPGSKEPKPKEQKRNLCPLVRSPGPDCYCRDMNSSKISMAVYFCQNHYAHCEIYKSMARQQKNKPESDKKRNGENNKEH